MAAHSLIKEKHFLSYHPAACELSRCVMLAHTCGLTLRQQIFLPTMEKESVLSMAYILPLPPVSPACVSPPRKETRRELTNSGFRQQVKVYRCQSIFHSTLRTTWRGPSFPRVLSITGTVTTAMQNTPLQAGSHTVSN